MLAGFYTAASGMLLQQKSIDVTSNNIANLKTPGFKTQRVAASTFQETLVSRQEGNQSQIIGSRSPIKVLEDTPVNFDPSYLEETGRNLDLALTSEGFFNIQGETDQFLTRNGSFEIDEEGYLVLKGAGRVLGSKGPIKVSTSEFTVDEAGVILNAKGRKIDTLLITKPANNLDLIQFTNGLFTLNNEADNIPSNDFQVRQRYLESANVDMNRELTQIMEAQRSLQSCSTILKGIDEINNLTANQIAKL